MKKGIIAVLAVLLAVVSAFTGYFYICGGEAQIENFDEASADYEAIAELCLGYYKENPSEEGRKTIDICDGYLEDYTNESTIKLNDEQKKASEAVREKINFLWVTEDSVIFWRDETKYYGLVYSDRPLSVIREMKADWYKGADYHRINSSWYEIGFFGI